MSDRPSPREFQTATLIYVPDNPEWPWWTHRVGEVVEQGGFVFGEEKAGHKTVEEALDYLKISMNRDLKLINDRIKAKYPHG